MGRPKPIAIPAGLTERIADLKFELLWRYPFWGHILAGVRLIWAPELPTLAATDGCERIWLNPRPLQQLDRQELGFVLMHELCHIVLDTLGREQGRDRRLWNQATDYAINRQVAHMPLRSEPDKPAWRSPSREIEGLGNCAPLFDPRFDHLAAEAIYDKLLKLQPVDGGGSPAKVYDEFGEALQADADHGGGIDLHVEPQGPQDRLTLERDEAIQRLKGAVERARQDDRHAVLPLGIDRRLYELDLPRVPWQALLQRYLLELGAANERSWARPHRRWLAEDVLVAGAVREHDGCVVVAVDTSGSMAQDQLLAVAAELAVLEQTFSDLWVVTADAKIHDVVAPGELRAFLARGKLRGGGGTDHRPVFEWIAQRGLRPALLVCCTDLRTALPRQGPDFPVLWLVLPDAYGERGPRPRFGEEIVVPLPNVTRHNLSHQVRASV